MTGDPIPDCVASFLRMISEMTTSTPTLRQIVEAGEVAQLSQDEVLASLVAATGLGLIDSADDYGPETLFVLSTLAAEKMDIRLTFDSRRWMDRESGQLVGPHDPDGRYRDRRPDTSEDLRIPLHERRDWNQAEPHEILALAERYGDEHTPMIHRFYGLGAIWEGDEQIAGTCPYCKGDVLGVHAYCLKCHNAGMDRFLTKPAQSRRKQMPKYQSKLKGGV